VQAGNDFVSVGYRHAAAAAKFAEQVAADYYDSDREVFGYLYGPSGGSLQTVGAAENVQGVWQGFVPVVQAIPRPSYGRPAAELILGDKAGQIRDALMPGGSGDPYATLDEAEKAMLTELHRLGIPWQGWENPDYLLGKIPRYFGAGLSSDTPLAYDPTYVDDFWNADGYLGTEDSPLGARVRAELTEMGDTVGHRWNIAKRFAYRYQMPAAEEGWIGFDQFRNPDGTPIYPQRAVGEPPSLISASGTSGFDGSVNGKVIVVQNLYDVDAPPLNAVWYRDRVQQSFGAAADDTYRVYFNDRADHQEGVVSSDAASLVSYSGMVEQALRDVASWAEDGIPAPPSTQYLVEDAQVIVGSDADTRGGVQPTAALTINGGDRAEVETGQVVKLDLTADVADGLGEIVETSFDFLGTGTFEDVPFGDPANEVSTSATHTYTTAGTVFAGVKVAADREGDVGDPNAQVLNIDRTRVIVHEGVAPVVAAVFTSKTVTLSATDDYSGVASIEYRTVKKPGATPSAWQTYTGPIKVTDSKTVVEYRATDNANKTSEVGSISAPVKTTVTGSTDRHLVRAGASVTYKVVVKTDSRSAPVGTLTVTDNGKVVATADMTADANGMVTIAIPALKRGAHLIAAKFAGAGYSPSTSFPDVVIAY